MKAPRRATTMIGLLLIALSLVGCDPATSLLVENRTTDVFFVRIEQPEGGPLVFLSAPGEVAWALHSIDMVEAAGAIQLLNEKCMVLGSWTGGGLLVIEQGSGDLETLPPVGERPSAAVRLSATSRCGGPAST